MNRRAFTLLEVVAAMTVMAVIAAVVAPLVASSADALADASGLRRASERVAFAADRAARLLREAPPAAAGFGLDLTQADGDEILFADGRGLRLDATDLLLLDPAGDAVLLSGVTAFELGYLGHDGLTDLAPNPAQAHRITLRLAADGFELRTLVFPRARSLR